MNDVYTKTLVILLITVFATGFAAASNVSSEEIMEDAVEKLRAEVTDMELQKLTTSCESATASLFITQDAQRYQRDVFDAVYRVTNVVARHRPRSTADIRWFEQRLPFCPFRIRSDRVEVLNYKPSGLGFVVIEGKIYKNGVNPDNQSIIAGKLLKFQM